MITIIRHATSSWEYAGGRDDHIFWWLCIPIFSYSLYPGRQHLPEHMSTIAVLPVVLMIIIRVWAGSPKLVMMTIFITTWQMVKMNGLYQLRFFLRWSTNQLPKQSIAFRSSNINQISNILYWDNLARQLSGYCSLTLAALLCSDLLLSPSVW